MPASLDDPDNLLMPTVSDANDGATARSIAYVGPILDGGRMDAILLADGLKGVGRLVGRVADLRGSGGGRLRLQVQGQFKSGSLEVILHFARAAATTAQHILDSKLVDELAAVMGITGFTLRDAGASLISWFKQLKGRPITDETDLSQLDVGQLAIDKAELIRIYNDPDVQAAIRAALRPIREEGVEEFQTRQGGQVVESVKKRDLLAADAAEMEAIVTNEVKILDVEKASFVPHLSWHLSDDGKPFDAKIEDPSLWEQVETGTRFGSGDRLHVDLHTAAERESNGRLRITRTITKVHRVERSGEDQMELF